MTSSIARFEKNLSYDNFIVIGRCQDEVTIRTYNPEGKINYYRCPVKVCEIDNRKMEGLCFEGHNHFADTDRNTESRINGNDAFDSIIEQKLSKGESIPTGFDMRDIHRAVKHAYHAEKVLRAYLLKE